MADKNSTSKHAFSVPEHSSCLLHGLASLQAQAKLFDATLTTTNEAFHVHKVVLAACSDAFRTIFTSDMREDTTELKGVSAKGLGRIIEFAYSAKVTLDLDCIQDVLKAAVILQMPPVVKICEEFLQSTISIQTCLYIAQIATTFSLASLKALADAFTFEHFLQVSEEADFLQLPLERLVFFLQSNKVKGCREVDLFWAAIRWLRHDPSRRHKASQVLCHIRFPLMKPSKLVDDVQSVDIMVEDALCHRYLTEALNYQILPFWQHEMQSVRTTIRSDVLSLIAFGGAQCGNHKWKINRKVYYLPNVCARQFKKLMEMETGSTHVYVAVLDNFIYVVGGQDIDIHGYVRGTNLCCRYDPRSNQWLPIKVLQKNRIRFQLNALHGVLYATGGWNASGPLASVEKYCPKRNEWSYVCPLNCQLLHHAGATIKGKLYLSGGEVTLGYVGKALHCYDPTADLWVFRTAMNESRSLHAMASTDSRIYVFGGIVRDGDDWVDVLSVEHYVPETNQWTTVSSMRMGQSMAGCCLLENKIFLVGGQNGHLKEDMNTVQVYNTETDKWERDLNFPESSSHIACAPVILPPEMAQSTADKNSTSKFPFSILKHSCSFLCNLASLHDHLQTPGICEKGFTAPQESMADKNSTSKHASSVAEHSIHLLRNLYSLRAQAKLLDITLATDNEAFQAHKVVLAACSDVFRALFTGDIREATQDVIELKGMSAKGLERIIEFSYSAEVTLDPDCVEDVLKAAAFLQMAPVVKICEEFLLSTISVQTCLNMGQIATTFSLASLKEAVDTIAFEHFLQVSEEADFLQLPLERLVFFLQSNKLKSYRQVDLFRAAIRWLRHDLARRSEASQVFCHIRFPLMKRSELVNDVQSMDIMVEDVLCHRYLMEAFGYQVLPFRQHNMQSPQTAIRSDVHGGAQDGKMLKISRKVYNLPNVCARQFWELLEMETVSSHTCVAVLDNFVYVIGGQDKDVHGGDRAADFCCRYDPHTNQWVCIQALQEKRISFQLNALLGDLYATGGGNQSGILASVEKYCPQTNKWSYVCPLKHQLWSHAGATIGGKLYISGGHGTSVDAGKALHCYDPTADQWVLRTAMNEPRILHAMGSSNSRIYVFGGIVCDGDNWVDVLSVEYYVLETNQWTTISSLWMRQYITGCCLLENKIFLVGGYNRHLQKDMSTVHVYNTETERWERDLSFPENLSHIACAPVILPQLKAQRRLRLSKISHAVKSCNLLFCCS